MSYHFNPHPDGHLTDTLAVRRAIAQSISRARQAAGLTQEEVAERLNIGPEAVSRLERGVGSITAERLVVLAEMFGCRSDLLLLGASPRQDDQAEMLSRLLDGLALPDRAFVIESVERLAEYLRSKAPKPERAERSR